MTLRRALRFAIPAIVLASAIAARPNDVVPTLSAHDAPRPRRTGRELFEKETFNGNGRTCRVCHSDETGTISPADAQQAFVKDPKGPLFQGDGSDDGRGNGVTRMLTDATILVNVPLAENVSLAQDPQARTVTLRRGIPTTLNTPSLDSVLMLDGREPDLPSQALSAIVGHAQARKLPTKRELERIAEFQHTASFFSSPSLRRFARGGPAPTLPLGRTKSEKRGRTFFEDTAFGPGNFKKGICAICHSGALLNETNEFIPVPPLARGGRFQSVLVSEFNAAGNPVQDFVFQNPDGTTTTISSPDPGRALITGDVNDAFESLNAFKIPILWGVSRTAPYFHDNSAKSLEDVLRHYAQFFALVTDPVVDGDEPVILTDQDQRDIIAFLRLLK